MFTSFVNRMMGVGNKRNCEGEERALIRPSKPKVSMEESSNEYAVELDLDEAPRAPESRKLAFFNELYRLVGYDRTVSELRRECNRIRAEAAQEMLLAERDHIKTLLELQTEINELISKKAQLEEEVRIARAHEEAALETCRFLQDDREAVCVICMDAKRGVVFRKCNHFATCISCAEKIDECCICKRTIVRKISVYYA